MSLTEAARTINATAYSYISSWALLTAAELRIFDRLPARSSELVDTFPDADLVDTWMLTLADAGLVSNNDGVWTQSDEMTTLLAGDNSYADYLGGQIMQQMTPRLTLGHTGENVLAAVLADPTTRRRERGLVRRRRRSKRLPVIAIRWVARTSQSARQGTPRPSRSSARPRRRLGRHRPGRGKAPRCRR